MAVFLPTTEVVSFAFWGLKMCFKLLQILSSMFLVESMSCKLWRYVILSTPLSIFVLSRSLGFLIVAPSYVRTNRNAFLELAHFNEQPRL